MRSFSRYTAAAPLLFFGALFPLSAQAATETDTFEVLLTIEDACAVTAGSGSAIDLGAQAASQTDIASSGTFTVNCSNSTPYYIGLAPSNGSTSGAGELASGTTTDKVPYQLRSATGGAGTIWGNTATSSAVGNGVAGTGEGSDQSYTVYVTVPDANFTPADYKDTVTVTVNF
ncbi:spore coat U domain-containing protein [Altericroceibacterium endophyticum]|uniref:Fimbrial major subunit CsuA/B family protein n=1 Tax=Altericroceibacterium endophyticum TaxID=1808508 RepID=A0A6I4T1C3_9SPHN|nr:spore coat protein U domain-containing protein [Altericroceibacterium endophyticum]MXO64142.1 fimbrial major subunit CsuA/B family protein [Altericroceibacterium endophyticum]